MNTIRIYNSNNYEIRTETINNVEYMVVPVVMMREGVHSGSHGAIYHRAEELGRYVQAWNGIPVVITHPQVNGAFVSANSPEIREQYAVGTIYNAHMDGDRLKADCYLLQADLERISPETLAMIQNGTNLDVSVGVFSDAIQNEGQWQGETYHSIAENYRPDHLALLPHEDGACNWNDGCGIRNNSSNQKRESNETGMDLKVFKAKEAEMNPPIIANQDFVERQDNIRSMLDGMDVWEPESDRRVHYLRELYESYFIYKVNMSGETKYYRQNYVMNESDAVELVGEPVEVRREVTYTPVQPITMKRTKKNGKIIINKEDSEMTLQEKVEQLIAHSAKTFCASDREFLLTQAEEKIDGWIAQAEIIANASTPPATPPAAPTVNTEGPKKPMDMAAYMDSLPQELRDQIAYGQQLHVNQRAEFITKIKAYEKNPYSDEQLAAMQTNQLAQVVQMIPAKEEAPQANAGFFQFPGSTAQPQVNTNEVPVMMPTGMEPKAAE